MSAYTNLNLNQVKEIADQFQLGTVMSKKILSGGSENSNYHLVTSSGDYVLTLCETKTKEETLKLASILLLLEENQYTTSKVIKLPDGNYISSYEGKPILVKEFIHGKVQIDFTNEQLFKIGASIAKLHNVPIPEYLSHTPSYGIESFRQHKLPDGFFKDWLLNIQKVIDPYLNPDLPVAMIHADIFDSNIIITEEGPVIMDFEEVCIYNCIYDLGMAIVGTCVSKDTVEILKTQHLISGYNSVNKLITIEEEHLPGFIIYAAAATAFWRFRQFNILEPDENQKDRYLEMVHIADNAKSLSGKDLII